MIVGEGVTDEPSVCGSIGSKLLRSLIVRVGVVHEPLDEWLPLRQSGVH